MENNTLISEVETLQEAIKKQLNFFLFRKWLRDKKGPVLIEPVTSWSCNCPVSQYLKETLGAEVMTSKCSTYITIGPFQEDIYLPWSFALLVHRVDKHNHPLNLTWEKVREIAEQIAVENADEERKKIKCQK